MRRVSAPRRRITGFTLTELAVVFVIVVLLLGSAMYTLSAQTEQRNFEETRRRLEQARELVLAYAIVNGRLPCPARGTATTSPVASVGEEVRNTGTFQCSGDHGAGAFEDYYGGTHPTQNINLGYLPAKTIGYQPIGPNGLALDVWGQPIRYAVAKTVTGCTGTSTLPHWTYAVNMKANGISCQPGDLLICKTTDVTPAMSTTSCGGTPSGQNQLVAQNLVVVVIFSTGKNGLSTLSGAGADEAANLDGAGNVNPLFVYHTPTPSTHAQGEFDDQMVWVTVGELYGRLIAAGMLP
jgi:type II secretory pathway pseudopilin PulG